MCCKAARSAVISLRFTNLVNSVSVAVAVKKSAFAAKDRATDPVDGCKDLSLDLRTGQSFKMTQRVSGSIPATSYILFSLEFDFLVCLHSQKKNCNGGNIALVVLPRVHRVRTKSRKRYSKCTAYTVDSARGLIVIRTHLVLASSKLVKV